MGEPHAIEAATKRLLLALDALEAAIERRREADRASDSLAAQVQALGADRSRLAAELDDAKARARELGKASREVSDRIDKAMDLVRAVLDAHQSHDTESEDEKAIAGTVPWRA